MNRYLRFEPDSDADSEFRNFMLHNLGKAAQHFGLTVVAPPTFGWRMRTISAQVAKGQEDLWLRVVSQEPEWAKGEAWTGTLEAARITEINKPHVIDVHEWAEGEWRTQRAELMTLLSGEPCSRTDSLRRPVDLPESWWLDLHDSLARLARVPTDRRNTDQRKITSRITDRFGTSVDTTVTDWETVHGDLHWSNLMRPHFGLLDWELWGRGPAGTDAATLLCYSLLVPSAAERVRAMFADQLGTLTGRVAQLYVSSRLLRRIEGGDHPDLAEPVRALARSAIDER